MQSAALTCSSPPSRPERPGSGCRWPLVRLSSRWSVTSASDTSPNLGGSPWAELGFLSAVLSVLSWRRRRSTSLSNRRCTFSCSAGAPGWARSADHASPQASSVARSVCLINETFTSECNQPSSFVIIRHQASSCVIRRHQVVIRWLSEGHQRPSEAISVLGRHVFELREHLLERLVLEGRLGGREAHLLHEREHGAQWPCMRTCGERGLGAVVSTCMQSTARSGPACVPNRWSSCAIAFARWVERAVDVFSTAAIALRCLRLRLLRPRPPPTSSTSPSSSSSSSSSSCSSSSAAAASKRPFVSIAAACINRRITGSVASMEGSRSSSSAVSTCGEGRTQTAHSQGSSAGNQASSAGHQRQVIAPQRTPPSW